jgi:hypothetical protein
VEVCAVVAAAMTGAVASSPCVAVALRERVAVPFGDWVWPGPGLAVGWGVAGEFGPAEGFCVPEGCGMAESWLITVALACSTGLFVDVAVRAGVPAVVPAGGTVGDSVS